MLRVPDAARLYITWYKTLEGCFASRCGITVRQLRARKTVTWPYPPKRVRTAPLLRKLRSWRAWGYLNRDTDTIHAWLAPTATLAQAMDLLAHEVGHTVRPRYRTYGAEENKANAFGWVGETAIKMYALRGRGHHAIA